MTGRLVFQATAAEAAAARAFVVDQARAAKLPPALVDDLETATSELATNAIEHGCRPLAEGGRFAVHFGHGAGAAVVTVVDQGCGCVAAGQDMPGPDAENGRGLSLARRLGAQIEVVPGTHVAIVSATFEIARYQPKRVPVDIWPRPTVPVPWPAGLRRRLACAAGSPAVATAVALAVLALLVAIGELNAFAATGLFALVIAVRHVLPSVLPSVVRFARRHRGRISPTGGNR